MLLRNTLAVAVLLVLPPPLPSKKLPTRTLSGSLGVRVHQVKVRKDLWGKRDGVRGNAVAYGKCIPPEVQRALLCRSRGVTLSDVKDALKSLPEEMRPPSHMAAASLG